MIAKGLAAVIIGLVVIAAIAASLRFLLAKALPSELTVIPLKAVPTRWTATTPLMTFHVIEAAGLRRGTNEVFGTLSLSSTGVSFEPSAGAMRGRGVEPLRWDPTWAVMARRLRGWGGQVQVSLVSADNRRSVTFWVRGGKAFPFP